MSRGFRVWDTESECYLSVSKGGNDGVLGVTINGNGIIYLEDGEANIQNNGVIIERDTGLKDKNGKRICEGDIIREKWYDNDVNRGRDRIGKIEYFCDRFVCWFGGTFVNLGMFPSENIEVIGNIHENPELLEN